MAYLINPLGKTHILYDGNGSREVIPATIQVDSETDLSDLPNDTISVGSLAATTDFGKIWRKGFDGAWLEVEL